MAAVIRHQLGQGQQGRLPGWMQLQRLAPYRFRLYGIATKDQRRSQIVQPLGIVGFGGKQLPVEGQAFPLATGFH